MQENPDKNIGAGQIRTAQVEGESSVASSLLSADQTEIAALTQQFKSATSWFYTVAALSVVNSFIALSGGTLHFIFGLGITSVADALIYEAGDAGKTIGLLFTLAMAGLFVIFGYLSKRLLYWAYVVGIAFYLLDGVLSLVISDYLGSAFHAFALFKLYGGLAPCKKLIAHNQAQAGNR